MFLNNTTHFVKFGIVAMAIMSGVNASAIVIDFEEFTDFSGGAISLQDTSVTSQGFQLTGSSIGSRDLYPQYIVEPYVNKWDGNGNGTQYFTQYPMNNGGWQSGALTITIIGWE